jgi:paraquat-inducible protein A
MSAAPLTACHECDLLQHETPLPLGGAAKCPRCGATLYRRNPESVDRALALTLGALALFIMANVFPIVGLSINGDLVQTTLFGTVRMLWTTDMRLVAGLVFLTTILMPFLQLAAMSALLLPVRLERTPPYAAALFRTLRAVEPWGMVEVFMLGVLVALVKLAHMATVVPGLAAWSFAGLMLVLAAAVAAFDPQAVWARVRPQEPQWA